MAVKLCLVGAGKFGRVLYDSAMKIDGIDSASWKDADGVIIASPNDAHYGNVLNCICAGNHIFVEKPLTSSYEDAVNLKRFIRKKQVFMVGHNQRREACFRGVKKLFDSGQLGKLVSAHFNFSHGGAFSFTPDQWRYNIKRHREGPLITAGSHLIDTTHYLFGRVKSVYARVSNVSGRTTAPDCNVVVANLKSGASVIIQANYNMPSEESCTIHCTEGTAYISRGILSIRLGRDRQVRGSFVPSKPTRVRLRAVDPVKEELIEYRDAILNGASVETGFQEGLNVMAIVEACYQSDKTGKSVSMSKFKDYRVKEGV